MRRKKIVGGKPQPKVLGRSDNRSMVSKRNDAACASRLFRPHPIGYASAVDPRYPGYLGWAAQSPDDFANVLHSSDVAYFATSRKRNVAISGTDVAFMARYDFDP